MSSNSKKLKKEQISFPSQDTKLISKGNGSLYQNDLKDNSYLNKRTDLLNIVRLPSEYILDLLVPKNNRFKYKRYVEKKENNFEIKTVIEDFDYGEIFKQDKMPTPTSSDNRVLLALIKNEKEGTTRLSITEIAKISGVHRTNIGKSLKRLASGLYLGNMEKGSKNILFTKRELIIIDKQDKNTYHLQLNYIESSSYSRIDLDKLNLYLKNVHNTQVDTATEFLFYYVRLLTSKNLHPISRILISSLELTVFARYKHNRNEYKSLLEKCLEGLKKIGYLTKYEFEAGNKGDQITINYPTESKKLFLY